MKNIVLVGILIFVLVDNIKSKEEKLENNSNKKQSDQLQPIVLKPKITISDISPEKYKFKLKNLLPYLENIIIVENPKLKNTYKKLTLQSNRPVELTKDLDINTKSSKYIIGFENKFYSMVGSKDNVFVSGLVKDHYTNYILSRPTVSYYHPITKEYLGTELLIIGKATILQRDEVSLLNIASAKEPIKLGTLVLPSRSIHLPSDLVAFYSDDNMEGYILSINSGINYAMNYDVAVVSLGLRDKIKVGQILNIKTNNLKATDPYDDNKINILPRYKNKGQIVVYDVFNKLSLGIVINISEEINLMDKVVSS